MKVKYITHNTDTLILDLIQWSMTLEGVLRSMSNLNYKVISVIDDNGREIIIGEPK